MTYRKHQQQVAEVIASAEPDLGMEILLHATPGAGKSAIPVIATDLIKRGMADRICWVVPRDSLRTQGEENFLDPFFRRMIGHNCTVRAATNEPAPCRGAHGFVTTYQAIGMDRHGEVAREFRKHRYVLILDEFHHLEREGVWMERVRPLYASVSHTILMTGTLERGDGKQIGIMPYKKGFQNGQRCLVPNLEHEDVTYIHYSRADALRERAIIPMLFYLTDGSARWDLRDGGSHSVSSIANANPHEVSPAIYTALRTEFARDLIEKSIVHWQDWKKKIKTARLLVVTADIKTARETLSRVRKLTGKTAAIATSHESVEAKRNIAAFKAGRVEILVTIAMAYEGLDVPEVSHICCLTHIRSTPWIEQMIARAVRVDKAYQYGGQAAHIFAPDDPLFREIVDRIEKEQVATCTMPRQKGEDDGQLTLDIPGDWEGNETESNIIPLGSKATGTREYLYGKPQVTEAEVCAAPVLITPRQREDMLRREVEIHVRRYCATNRVRQQKINAEIKEYFGKSRGNMSGAEMGAVLAWVQQNYPTGYQVRGRRPRADRSIQVFNG